MPVEFGAGETVHLRSGPKLGPSFLERLQWTAEAFLFPAFAVFAIEPGERAMFKKVLLPIDMSDRHQRALDVALELAGRNGGEIVLLHVIEVIAGSTMEEERDFYGRLEKAARKHLDHLGARVQQRQVPWSAEILYGTRVPEIARNAREIGADLIVLTSPQPDPKNPAAGWGSLSYRVSLLASCPVLLVK
jgi:nucleotide-binding universal stress UspA family protein